MLQQGSPAAWLQLPRWSRGQGVKTRSPQRSLFLGAWPAVLGTEKHEFPTDSPHLPAKAYTTRLETHPASFLVQKHSSCPQTQGFIWTSVTTRVKSPIPAGPSVIVLPPNTPVPTPLSAFQRRPDTHLEFPLPRRPPAGRPNSLFMPTSRKGDMSNRWESADKETRDRQTARRKRS